MRATIDCTVYSHCPGDLVQSRQYSELFFNGNVASPRRRPADGLTTIRSRHSGIFLPPLQSTMAESRIDATAHEVGRFQFAALQQKC